MTHEDLLRRLHKATGGKIPVDYSREPIKPGQEVVVGCGRVAHGPTATPRSVVETCVMCGEPVWAAPSSVEMVKTLNAKLKCLECVIEHDSQRPDFRMHALTPSQQIEINQRKEMSNDKPFLSRLRDFDGIRDD